MIWFWKRCKYVSQVVSFLRISDVPNVLQVLLLLVYSIFNKLQVLFLLVYSIFNKNYYINDYKLTMAILS